MNDYGYSEAMRHIYFLASCFALADALLTGLVVVSIAYLGRPGSRLRWSIAAVTFAAAVFLIAWHALLGLDIPGLE